MIKHIVFIKIKGASSDDVKLNDLNTLKAALDALPAQISQIKKYEVGINISDSNSASDLAIVSEFDSKDDLEAYKTHAEHLKVIDLISSIKGRTAVVDYEF